MMQERRGFTLIELLVVIAIIAVLMAILMPALQRVKEQARDQVCRAHLRGVGLGVVMYLQDNEHIMPDMVTHHAGSNGHLWWDETNGQELKATDDMAYWGIAYIDYVKNRELFGCSAFRNFCDMIASGMLYTSPPELIYTSAYAGNGWLTMENTARIPRHSQVILAHDHVEPRIENGLPDMLYNEGATNNPPSNLQHYREGGGRSEWYRGIFRHNVRIGDDYRTGGSLNILWLDGHTSGLKETNGDEVYKRWYNPLGKNWP